MREKISYEFWKQAPHFRGIVWTNTAVNFLSLLFFSIVGNFEPTATDSILTNIIGIVTLSATISISVATIYGVVLFNRLLLRDYIQNARERTYLFPEGRTTLFMSKIYALILHFLLSFFPILLFENLVFYFFSVFIGFLSVGFLFYLLSILGIVSFSAIFAVILILLSLLSGQRFQSINASLITSVITVSIMGNLVAQLYQLNTIIVFILFFVTIVSVLTLTTILKKRIISDDVIDNSSGNH